MKHTLKITIILVLVFFLSQIIGLSITSQYINFGATEETGIVNWDTLPYNISRPPVEGGSAFTSILFAILLGTGLIFLIMKYGKVFLWKAWFFLAVSVCLVVAFNAFMPAVIAGIIAIILAGFKIYKPNIWVHNISELFIYGGLAVIFVPVLDIFWVFLLLLAISMYDMIAVWKSKHMISLAKFQTKSKVFAGLFVPYKLPKKTKGKNVDIKKVNVKSAILGGGDIGFPLFFSGVVLKNLALIETPITAFLKTLIVTIFITLSLLLLFLYSKKDRFYPAMPFLTAGCIVGYGVLLLVNLFI